MHKIFGEKENEKYLDRYGAYIVPVKDGKIAVVKTPKGYFFIGGGIEENESCQDAIKRECLEETGYRATVGKMICSAEAYVKHSELGYFHPVQYYYTGILEEKVQEPTEGDHRFVWIDYKELQGNLFPKMQNWALEQIMDYLKN